MTALTRPQGALAGATLVVTLAATASILVDAGVWSGVACAIATILLAMQGRLRLSARGRFLDAATGFIFDAAVLGAASWTLRGTSAGTAALIALSLSLFSDYLVARARSLRYLMDDGIATRALRCALVSVAFLVAVPTLWLWVLVGVCAITATVRGTQIPKVELASA